MYKVLIADDDKTMLGLLTTLLDLEGHTSCTVTRPEDVVPVTQHEQPDIILLDMHLAGGDSLMALSELKSDAELCRIPVLMASGMDLEETCRAAGADDFILKPFRPTELINRLNMLAAASDNITNS